MSHSLPRLIVFSERTTLRSLYAIGRPSVCLLSVCCLWRWCTLLRRLNFSAIFFHHTIAQELYFSGAKNRWWGTPLSPWNLRSKWPTPFKTAQFRPISAHNASTVISSEKSSISTYRKSTTRFPMSHGWTVYVTPKSPKRWHKNAISLFVPVKFNFSRKRLLPEIGVQSDAPLQKTPIFKAFV